MTLRDDLAAALGRVYAYAPVWAQADAILSDPAFREALVEAMAAILPDTTLGWYLQRNGKPNAAFWERDARAIVARMLGDGDAPA